MLSTSVIFRVNLCHHRYIKSRDREPFAHEIYLSNFKSNCFDCFPTCNRKHAVSFRVYECALRDGNVIESLAFI